MLRGSSTVIVDHMFAPLRSLRSVEGQVPKFASPDCGMTWNSHTCLPVMASHARMSPRGCGGPNSPGRAPAMIRFLYTDTGLGTVEVLRRFAGTSGPATLT